MDRLDWQHLFFRFDGRINRAKYWLVILINVVAILAAAFLFVIPGLGWILFAVVVLAAIYVGIAVAVKRLHDRNKSGLWLLLFYLVPAVLQGIAGDDFSGINLVLNIAGGAISLWALVELGFLRGTAGANDYGPDPLETAFERA